MKFRGRTVFWGGKGFRVSSSTAFAYQGEQVSAEVVDGDMESFRLIAGWGSVYGGDLGSPGGEDDAELEFCTP